MSPNHTTFSTTVENGCVTNVQNAGAKTVHLFRGAPCVRSWSPHRATVPDWTLCGIRQDEVRGDLQAVEDPDEVSCPFCRKLMAPEPRSGRKEMR